MNPYYFNQINPFFCNQQLFNQNFCNNNTLQCFQEFNGSNNINCFNNNIANNGNVDNNNIQNNILNNNINNNIYNQNNNNKSFNICFKGYIRIEDFDGYNLSYDINTYIYINNLEETIGNLLSKFCKMFGINQKNYCFIFKGKSIDNEPNKTLSELDLPKDSNCLSINIVNKHDISGAGDAPTLQIFIKFIKFNNYSKFNCNVDLKGILKLCLLNEITSKWNDINLNEIKKFSEIAYIIMKILKYSYIPSLYEKEASKNIKEVLEKVSGSNIISFSNFVEEEINSDCLNKIMNFLNKNDLTEINDIKFCLGKYNKYMTLFEKEFQNSLKQSIFEFSVISLVVLDREDFDTFETEREKCPNRVEQILYHGTQIHPIS